MYCSLNTLSYNKVNWNHMKVFSPVHMHFMLWNDKLHESVTKLLLEFLCNTSGDANEELNTVNREKFLVHISSVTLIAAVDFYLHIQNCMLIQTSNFPPKLKHACRFWTSNQKLSVPSLSQFLSLFAAYWVFDVVRGAFVNGGKEAHWSHHQYSQRTHILLQWYQM